MKHQTIQIWEGFHYDGKQEGFSPRLDTYLPEGTKVRPAILVLPGGGYRTNSPREAEQIALQFNAAGFHAFVLWYSVYPNKHPQPLRDVARAITLIRQHAEEWLVDPQNIAVCGFSAGGHLAASSGTLWNSDFVKNVPGIDVKKTRPDALVLSYPVITSGSFAHQGSFESLLADEETGVLDPELKKFLSLEERVAEDTPPTFLWHTFKDSSVPVENSLLFAKALRAHGVPFEMHIYPDGPHGLSLATAATADREEHINSHVASWMGLCVEWLKLTFGCS